MPTPHELGYATPDPHLPNKPFFAAIACITLFIPTVIINFTIQFSYPLLILALPALPLAALVFAIAARRTTRRDHPNTRQARIIQKFAWSELLFLAFFSALIPAMMPSYSGRSRETANRVKCRINLRHIGYNLVAYANANGGRYPSSLDVLMLTPDAHPRDLLTWDHFICPSSAHETARGPTTQAAAQIFRTLPNHNSYIYAAANLDPATVTPDHILAAEPLHNHTNAGANFLFGDGHVEFLNQPGTAYYLSELKSGHNPPRPPRP